MSDHPHERVWADRTWCDTDGPVHPGEESPARVASELFVHGLLGALEEQPTDACERRVRRVMHAIAPPAPIPIARGRFHWRAVAAVAAGLALVVLLFLYEQLPLERTAMAEAAIQSAIRASRSPGDQRYEIRIVREGDGELPDTAEATIDTRAPNLLLLHAQGPEGRVLIAGRDGEGEWAIRRDGDIERDRARGRGIWPRWITSNEQAIFADSIDVFLEFLARRYTLSKGEPDPEVPSLDHIVGVRKQSGGPSADRVDVFIDRQTNLVERLEMRWSPETQAEMKRRWQERLREGMRGPDDGRDGRGRSPREPLGVDGDGPPPLPDGAEGRQRPHREGRDGREWGDGGKRERMPRDGDDTGGPGRRPEFADGFGKGFGDGSPKGDRCLQPKLRYGGDGHPRAPSGPPRLFVIERVEPPPFDDAWFSPETHVETVKEAAEAKSQREG